MSSDPAVLPDGALQARELTKRFAEHQRAGAWRYAFPGHLVAAPPPGPAVLDALTLDVEPGSTVGIIGPNGAGKSTLLKLLAGIVTPTSGTIEHGGRVGSMIELGIGFHPDLTGWENLFVAGTLLGLTRAEIVERAGRVVEFADLADAMDTPVKRYSTGMAARLGFALATHIDASILAIDEVLSVGDRVFQEKCLDRITELNDAGCTVLFVSHELSLVDLVCERAIRLERGRIVDDGPAGEVIQGYLGRPVTHLIPGPPTARITSIALDSTLVEPLTSLAIDLEVEVLQSVEVPPNLAIELSLPSIAPGIRIAAAEHPVPIDWATPGLRHLRGRTTPLPLSGGTLRLTAALRSGVRADVATADADFSITGSRRIVKPMIVLDPEITVEPIEEPPSSAGTRRRRTGAAAVRIVGASKRFRTGTHRVALASAWPGRFGRPRSGDRVALDDVHLDVYAGEALGLIGPNGAGKSTLLKAIAGVHELDAGTIEAMGRVTAVLELGVGFHPDLSGRENVVVSAAMHGMVDEELTEHLPAILELAGIGDAIDQPVKHYSSGMRARLGLALATYTPAEIVLLDELLAVGDEEFRLAAKGRIRDLVADGAAVVFVSHNLELVREVCDRVVRLETGRVVDDGPTQEVLERYGGTGWSAGAAIGTGPIRLHELVLDERTGDPAVGFTFMMEITEDVPHVRIELTLRDSAIDRSQFRTPEKIERISGAMEVVIADGDLPGPGWYLATGTSGPVPCDGRFDLTIAAVNGRDGEAMAEVWKLAHFGDGRAIPRARFDVEWEPIAAPAAV